MFFFSIENGVDPNTRVWRVFENHTPSAGAGDGKFIRSGCIVLQSGAGFDDFVKAALKAGLIK